MNSNYPLVSVLIITYNSSKYVLETLESIKSQTYQNIELIISDDCSIDDTVCICSRWIEINKSRFINAHLVTTKENTGTAGNCNRALNMASGKWLKFLGADDLLMPNAITTYVNFVEGTNMNVVIGEAIHFSGNLSDKLFTYERIALENLVFSKKISANQQYHILSKQFIGSGPTLFVSKECVLKVGAFDERYSLQEDYPLFINLTKAGYKMFLLPVDTIYKRVHDDSVSHNKGNNAIYPSMIIKCIIDYRYEFKRKELGPVWRKFLDFSLWLHLKVIESGNNNTKFSCRCWYFAQQYFDPFEWYSRLLNLMSKLL